MHIVVTGAAGFIGSHLVERLLAEGHQVTGVDCFLSTYPRPVKEANLHISLAHSRFRLFDLDLRHDDLSEAFSGAEAVIHQAARTGLPRSWSGFDQYMTCNIQATHRVLEACCACGIERMVYASTSSVYGSEAIGTESQAAGPVSIYGVTKLAGEELCWTYARAFDLSIVCCRYFSIFGPRQRPDMAYHIFARSLLVRRPITIFGDGSQSRGSTYVSDCVEGTLLALELGRSGRIYNLGGGQAISLLAALNVLERLTGQAADLRFLPERPGDQRNTLADCSRARAELLWRPRVGIEEGLAREVEWIRDSLARGTLG